MIPASTCGSDHAEKQRRSRAAAACVTLAPAKAGAAQERALEGASEGHRPALTGAAASTWSIGRDGAQARHAVRPLAPARRHRLPAWQRAPDAASTKDSFGPFDGAHTRNAPLTQIRYRPLTTD